MACIFDELAEFEAPLAPGTAINYPPGPKDYGIGDQLCAVAALAMPRPFAALTCGRCGLVPIGSVAGRLKTAASMALITFCCMIWFLSIDKCPTPGTAWTSTFSSAPRKSLVRVTGSPTPLAT